MTDSPIDKGDVKSNVPAGFFALDPFVTEYFRSLGAKCLVKPRFHEALRRTLRNIDCHKDSLPVELEHLQTKVIHSFGEPDFNGPNSWASSASTDTAFGMEPLHAAK